MVSIPRNIVAIGGSAGSLEALRTIVAALPVELAAAVFVVIHTSPDAIGALDQILARAGPLPAAYGVDGQPIEYGTICIAPPDRHLILKQRHIRITRGPRENHFRPAVDPLFRTAALAHGDRVVGVVLSGGQDDGAVGLATIKRLGGVTIVQDPEEAVWPGMPRAAMRHVQVDHVLGARDIASVLVGLVGDRMQLIEDTMNSDDLPRDVAEEGDHAIHDAHRRGTPSPFTCPDCGGTLHQSVDGELLQFACHIGHRYSGEALAGAQDEALDRALWAGLRALEERSELRRRMASHAQKRGMQTIAASYQEQAMESEQNAQYIRRVLMPENGVLANGDAAERPERVASRRRSRTMTPTATEE